MDISTTLIYPVWGITSQRHPPFSWIFYQQLSFIFFTELVTILNFHNALYFFTTNFYLKLFVHFYILSVSGLAFYLGIGWLGCKTGLEKILTTKGVV